MTNEFDICIQANFDPQRTQEAIVERSLKFIESAAGQDQMYELIQDSE